MRALQAQFVDDPLVLLLSVQFLAQRVAMTGCDLADGDQRLGKDAVRSLDEIASSAVALLTTALCFFVVEVTNLLNRAIAENVVEAETRVDVREEAPHLLGIRLLAAGPEDDSGDTLP